MKRVVIVGGGFGGLSAAKVLGNQPGVEVTLLDKRNHHLFQPLLYQVALAALSPADISVPLREVLSRYKNISVFLSEVKSVDMEKKVVKTDYRNFEFDYLILACGSKHSYFGNDSWEPHAPGLKTLEQATEIRRRVLLSYELAERGEDTRDQRFQTFVVIGGGPTGVELAGAISEVSQHTLKTDFKSINPKDTKIHLIEAGDRLLGGFTPKLSNRAQKDLEKLGVDVLLGKRVTKIDADGVEVDGKERINAATVLWAAGVAPSSVNASLGADQDRAGRIFVKKDLSLAKNKDVFVIGDQANFQEEGKPLPGLAPVALQQGRHAGKTILRDVKGKERKPFHYFDKGMLATIGRKKAVGYFKGVQFAGAKAWWMWLLVHIYFLVGFRNKVEVLISWAWSYLTFNRSARLILSKEWQDYAVGRVDSKTSS